MINISKTEFIKSAADSKGFISDGRSAAVFAGRSNVGKSSTINRLLNQKNFARVGKTPGKTVQVNYFLVDGHYFIDLPGYGFARVSGEEKRRWGMLMESFFSEPARISIGVLIVDARHDPTPDDLAMADYFRAALRPFCVVANKIDKVKKSERAANLARIRETLVLADVVPLIAFSAETGEGRGELMKVIEGNL